ncbi:hypothetical protein [Cyclobacterium xiamenense]|uniref:hypothetical protein n=1 Tax=Cyclobacterium xiamenense TaxID=1297121 RepID=UPI0012B712A8|nr:hypothetical protein [Cyclobacterium xiamenense]
MKNSKKNFEAGIGAWIVLPALLLFSCVEEPLEQQPSTQTENIEELQATAVFDWKTSDKITVTVEGLDVDVAVNRKLTLETETGDEFFAGAQAMSEDFEMTFDLPSHVTAVTMKYGAIEQEREIVDNRVAFDFIVDMGDEDLEP